MTWPLWFFPVKIVRPKWIEHEKKRLHRRMDQPLIEAGKINWILRGTILFGGLMWIAMSVAPQALRVLRGYDVTWNTIWIQLPIWLLGGFAWGGVMHFWMKKKRKKIEKGGGLNDPSADASGSCVTSGRSAFGDKHNNK